MMLLVTALLTMFWLFAIAVYVSPTYRRVLARQGQ